MKEYYYSGPASGVTLSDGTEILLWPGETVTLPEGNEYVKVLVALGHLTPLSREAEVTSVSEPKSPARKNKENTETEVKNAG